MSVPCDCVECGGKKIYPVCENKLTEAFVEAYRPKHLFAFAKQTMVRDVAFSVFLVLLLILMFVGGTGKA